jgi:hypothetical protein
MMRVFKDGNLELMEIFGKLCPVKNVVVHGYGT